MHRAYHAWTRHRAGAGSALRNDLWSARRRHRRATVRGDLNGLAALRRRDRRRGCTERGVRLRGFDRCRSGGPAVHRHLGMITCRGTRGEREQCSARRTSDGRHRRFIGRRAAEWTRCTTANMTIARATQNERTHTWSVPRYGGRQEQAISTHDWLIELRRAWRGLRSFGLQRALR